MQDILSKRARGDPLTRDVVVVQILSAVLRWARPAPTESVTFKPSIHAMLSPSRHRRTKTNQSEAKEAMNARGAPSPIATPPCTPNAIDQIASHRIASTQIAR